MLVYKEKKTLMGLKRGKENEKKFNKKHMEQRIGAHVLYGEVIQLLHRKSKKFLTVDETSIAKNERENLKVCLCEEGNSLSWFKCGPHFKIDRDGEPIMREGTVCLGVVARDMEWLHYSHPKSSGKQHGIMEREVNCSLETVGWQISLYSEFPDPASL